MPGAAPGLKKMMMNVTWTPQIVAAVLAFVGMLIFVHELGHFLEIGRAHV